MTEFCRFCSYKFKEGDSLVQCPLCCGSRDRYANFAKTWGCTREEAKAKLFHLDYMVPPRPISEDQKKKIFDKYTTKPVFYTEEGKAANE